MQLTCPNCAAAYEVPEDAIGPNGRKVRCRACQTSWFEPSRRPLPLLDPLPAPVAAVEEATPPAAIQEEEPAPPPRRRRLRGPWLLLLLVVLVAGLGAVAAILALGPQQVASELGLADKRVPLGIAITREPDWRMIAGGSQLFAVSGRVWNPTGAEQAVPDIRAELKDARGKTVYAWTITRPVARLAPGGSAVFDGAAVDVPASSSNVSVSFAGTDDR